MMDAQVEPGCFILGDDLSVLDLYVTVTSRWGRAGCASIKKRPSAQRSSDGSDPRLTKFWSERFPSGRAAEAAYN